MRALTEFGRTRYDARHGLKGTISHGTPEGGSVEPAERTERTGQTGQSDRESDRTGQVWDLDRLERALTALIEQNGQLRDERNGLRQDLQRSMARVATLEGQLLDANQRRKDVAKRIDELIAQIDQLDAQLALAPTLDARPHP